MNGQKGEAEQGGEESIIRMCVRCGYLYPTDEEDGSDDDGRAVEWDELPDDWTCPDCHAPKCDFDGLFVLEEAEGR